MNNLQGPQSLAQSFLTQELLVVGACWGGDAQESLSSWHK